MGRLVDMAGLKGNRTRPRLFALSGEAWRSLHSKSRKPRSKWQRSEWHDQDARMSLTATPFATERRRQSESMISASYP